MFENITKDLSDYDFWKLVLAGILFVAGGYWTSIQPVCLALAAVLGIHTVMPW